MLELFLQQFILELFLVCFVKGSILLSSQPCRVEQIHSVYLTYLFGYVLSFKECCANLLILFIVNIYIHKSLYLLCLSDAVLFFFFYCCLGCRVTSILIERLNICISFILARENKRFHCGY